MNKFLTEEIVDYLDGTLRSQLFFARDIRVHGQGAEPWKQCSYHAVSVLKNGGVINTRFENDLSKNLMRSKGDVCFLPAYRKRQVEISASDGNREIEITAVGVMFHLCGNLDLLSFWNIPFIFDPEAGRAIDQTIDRLVALEKDKGITSLELLVGRKELVFNLLKLITNASEFRSDASARLFSYKQLEPAVHKMDRDFRNEITVAELAKRCALSRSQFHYNFKRIIGVSPLEYQQQLRLTEAKRLLLQSDESIAVISEKVGWQDQFYFSRLFKKTNACSPTEFRKRNNWGFMFEY
ncbi:MAG: helix-turn-helix transcriptional regulator [Victivallales bacterium]|nr:helix-turn-helix transcriptional regulator [Victivallales bacterium]